MDPKRDYVERDAAFKTLIGYTRKSIDSFGDYIEDVRETIKDPKSNIDVQTQFVEDRVNKTVSAFIHKINESKVDLVTYISSYKENAYSKLTAEKEQSKEFESVDKLMARCHEKYKEWKHYYEKHDFDERLLKNMLLELVDLKRRLYEYNDTQYFSSQRLFSSEKKFYRQLDCKANIADDFFYMDLTRLKNVKEPKILKFPTGKTTDCCVIASYGSRVITTWCEYGMCRLQLLEFDENSETMSVVNTVTNTASEDVMIAGSHKDNMIALAFTYDKSSYWIKAYSTELRELGILRLTYAPFALHVDENYLYVMSTATPLLRVYNSKLEELTAFSRDVNSDIYYLLRYGNQIIFKNDFVFFINENKHLDVILRSNDQVIKTLDIPNVKSFEVDSLLRLVVYSENPSKFTIYDLNNNVIQELPAKPFISSFCVTDNGFLVATNAYDGEISLY